jgi:hypothetical protein
MLARTVLVGWLDLDQDSATAFRHTAACLLSRTVNIVWFCSPSRPSMAKSSVDTLTSEDVTSSSRRSKDLAPRILNSKFASVIFSQKSFSCLLIYR